MLKIAAGIIVAYGINSFAEVLANSTSPTAGNGRSSRGDAAQMEAKELGVDFW